MLQPIRVREPFLSVRNTERPYGLPESEVEFVLSLSFSLSPALSFLSLSRQRLIFMSSRYNVKLHAVLLEGDN